MCDMTAVAIGAVGAGTLMQAAGEKQRGAAQKAEDFRSGESAERAAAQAVERGNLRGAQVAARGSEMVAEQRVMFSGTGADINVGAPRAVTQSTEAATEGEKKIVAYSAAMEGYGLKLRARSAFQRGKNAEAEAEARMVGTFLGGAAKITGQVAKKYADAEEILPPHRPEETDFDDQGV